MKTTTLVACLLCVAQLMNSQESLNASGSEATGTGGTVSYSVGQVFYSTQTGSNGTLSEGVQQPDTKTIYIFNSTWIPSDPSGIATAGDDIIIASGDATIGANTTSNSVTINPGAGLIIDPGMTLSTTNGLILESSSTSYSSLILDGIVTGTLEYERHVNINGSGTTGSNDLISAPLTGEAFSDFATNNPNIFNNGTLYLFGPFEKVTGTFVTWADIETATLEPGVGFRAASSDNGSFTFNGTANTGTITNNIVNTGSSNEEWNLIGNPYPSYLNVQAFLSHEVAAGVSNLDLFDVGTAAIYGYDGDAQDGWTIYNLANTTPSTRIAPGQGFFVSADATNASLYDLEFTPAMRSTGSGDDFIAGRNAELTFVKLNASTATNSYNTEFYFNANATEGFDFGYDAKVWDDASSDFAIYSHLVQDNTGNAIALQTLDLANLSEVTIPLGINANQGEQLTFSIADMTLPATVSVYLEDVVTNTVTLLNTSDYILTPTTVLSGTGRFFLRISDGILSTIETDLDALNIFALNTSKELVVNGQLQDNTALALYDIQGRKVLSTELDATLLQNRLDVSSLSTGVYVVQLQNNAQQISQKVIIK